MPDNLNIRQPQDPTKVNVNEPWEVRTWTAKFGCTETELRAAVKAVGVMVVDVQKYLKQVHRR